MFKKLRENMFKQLKRNMILMSKQTRNFTGKIETKNKNKMDGKSIKWYNHFGKPPDTFSKIKHTDDNAAIKNETLIYATTSKNFQGIMLNEKANPGKLYSV